MGLAVALLASASAPPCIEESCVRVGPNTKKPADITSTIPSLVMTAIATAIPALQGREGEDVCYSHEDQ